LVEKAFGFAPQFCHFFSTLNLRPSAQWYVMALYAEGAPNVENSPVSGTAIFLLVEDDPNDVVMLEMEFKKVPAPIHMVTVGDGREAMQYLERTGKYADPIHSPMPDVILLDLKMPRVSGFEFLEWLRAKAPQHCRFIPVVVMSSSGLREDVDRAYALGANSYLVKPVQWALFKERIQALGIYWAEHVERPTAPVADVGRRD
jgi:CheY-like chemotaxis protein